MFCRIVGREEPGDIIYEDDDVMVFRNRLRWAPVMLLAVPKKHMTQEELWSNEEMGKVAATAARIGKEQCPNGFRLLSNFGHDGMQSQPHGHIHIIGGIHLGPYV